MTTNSAARQQYGWAGTVQQYLATSQQVIINALQNHAATLFPKNNNQQQGSAWQNQLSVLTKELTALVAADPTVQQWCVVLEYELPQESGRRPDVVVLAGSSVIVLEFKNKPTPDPGDLDQLIFYVRDLVNYHSIAHTASSVTGALVLTKAAAPTSSGNWQLLDANSVGPFLAQSASASKSSSQITCGTWVSATYQPAPGLLTAAITGWLTNPPQLPSHFATNVPQVRSAIAAVVKQAQIAPPSDRHVVIVTGVPGAGKSFLGLDLVHDATIPGAKRFLSGNGPLVSVLNRALNQTQQLVTPLHKYRDYYSAPGRSPNENIIIFDEAQRTIDQGYMQAKFNKGVSEARLMLDIASRTPGWGVLVLLAGTGQEIYKGESGLQIWFDELAKSFPHINWHVHCSKQDIACLSPTPPPLPNNVALQNGSFHLNVAVRQHGAIEAAQWVKHVLAGNPQSAYNVAQTLETLPGKAFLLSVTQNLAKAKSLMQNRYANEPSARFGFLSVSGNDRLLAKHGVPVLDTFAARGRNPVDDIADWYLDPVSQPTSCGSLRKAATEFQCQGLDLDSTIVCWGNDLKWDTKKNKWGIKPVTLVPPIPNPNEMRLNKYRVILTRARDGMTIFVPPEPSLTTTFQFLVACGAVPF